MIKYLKVYSNRYQRRNGFITKARKHKNTKKIEISCFPSFEFYPRRDASRVIVLNFFATKCANFTTNVLKKLNRKRCQI
jgi:hypothetical protein